MPEASMAQRVFAGLDAVLAQLGNLSTAYIVPLLLCEVAVQLSKGLKWTAILRTVHPVRYSSALRGVVIGAAATHLVPLRLDEILRAGVVAKRERIAPETVFGTVIVDRIAELVVLGLVLASLAALPGALPGIFDQAALVLGGGAAGALLLCGALLRWEENIRRKLPATDFGGRLGGGLGALNQGLRSLPKGKNLGLLILGAVAEWTATICFYVLVLHMAGVITTPKLSVLMALGNTVSYALPNLPGALGFFELVQGGMLEALAALKPEEATAIALSAHAILMFPVTLVGLVLGFFEWRNKTTP